VAAPRTFIVNDPHQKGMQKTRSALLVILMMAAALAGCISEDTSDLDTQIEDLGTQNTELTQTIAERDLAISELEATIAGLESNAAGLEASIPLMEEQRDSLLALLSESQEFANQTIALADAMNETIVGLYIMLGENATLVQQLQSELIIQENLAIHWRDVAENNSANGWSNYLAGTDLSGADLTGALLVGASLYGTVLRDAYLVGVNLTDADMRYADLRNAYLGYADLTGADTYQIRLEGVTWANTICPDGTNSDDNENTCANNL